MTEVELFDFLRARFGMGEYVEPTTVVLDQRGEPTRRQPKVDPYWKWRGTEIAKLRGMLKRRRTSVDEMMLGANYAIERGLVVRTPFDVLLLIDEAKRERRKATPAHRASARERLTRAAQEAAERGDMDLARRLMVADDRMADELLAEVSHG